MTVNGTDFRIEEPTPFSTVWHSHKFNEPGLRHEAAACMQVIVWINGPFKPGRWSDLAMFRWNLKQRLASGEMVEVNVGCRGEPNHARTADGFVSRADDRAKWTARNCHKTANWRLKQFGCLKQVWRHDR